MDGRHFEGEDYVLQDDGFQSFFRVVGRVNRTGTRASGILFYFEYPLDPPGAPQRPDCGTRGQVRWQAKLAT